MEEHADRFPLHLSGGQQQRVAIARALMMKPQVLLFDEPTAALDPEITAQVVDIIKELQQTGITQVIVTHEVNVAQKVATKVVYMEQGKIIEMGSADCFDNPKTEQFKTISFTLRIRKHNMKKLLLSAMLMGSAFAANAQEITFAMEPSYPPFETTNEKGEIIGFDVDVANAIL